MTPQIPIPNDQIARFCQRWQIEQFALFGSVLRDDFKPTSDVDVLVKFSSESHNTLFDMVQMKSELEVIFGRTVDLISKRGIENSRNPYRKKAILGSASVIYGS